MQQLNKVSHTFFFLLFVWLLRKWKKINLYIRLDRYDFSRDVLRLASSTCPVLILLHYLLFLGVFFFWFVCVAAEKMQGKGILTSI